MRHSHTKIKEVRPFSSSGKLNSAFPLSSCGRRRRGWWSCCARQRARAGLDQLVEHGLRPIARSQRRTRAPQRTNADLTHEPRPVVSLVFDAALLILTGAIVAARAARVLLSAAV
jgi:hypothetical protein